MIETIVGADFLQRGGPRESLKFPHPHRHVGLQVGPATKLSSSTTLFPLSVVRSATEYGHRNMMLHFLYTHMEPCEHNDLLEWRGLVF